MNIFISMERHFYERLFNKSKDWLHRPFLAAPHHTWSQVKDISTIWWCRVSISLTWPICFSLNSVSSVDFFSFLWFSIGLLTKQFSEKWCDEHKAIPCLADWANTFIADSSDWCPCPSSRKKIFLISRLGWIFKSSCLLSGQGGPVSEKF